MQVVLVNYGEYGNNSSNHIDGFARGLVRRGHQVGMVADGSPVSTLPGVAYASFEALERGEGDRVVRDMLEAASTLLHVWTPRERVRRWVEPLAGAGLRYVVHLEDDEEIVTRSQTRQSDFALHAPRPAGADELVPLYLSHPVRARSFLAGAAGITVIVEALRAQVPVGVPVLLLEPGADTHLFRRDPDVEAREARRARLGLDQDAILLAYHGGVHPAVQRDMFSLYTAVAKLRRAQHDVALLRLGTSLDAPEVSTAFRRAEGVIQVAPVSRAELPSWLDMGDIYVQPGAASVFNVRRLPSKLLDFFAMGRPVVLPRTNVGLRCRDGHDAVLLRQGGAEEIMRCVLGLMSDRDAMDRIGRNGCDLVERAFDWDDKVTSLESFYASL